MKMKNILSAVTALLVLGLAFPLVPAAQQQSAGASGAAANAMNISVGELAQNPANYYGKKVTVRADVEDVLSENTFLLDEDHLFAWPDVLVVVPSIEGAIPEDVTVTVSGTVRPFVMTDLRRDYDWTWWDRLDADLELTLRNRPVIIADSVRTTDGRELIRQSSKSSK